LSPTTSAFFLFFFFFFLSSALIACSELAAELPISIDEFYLDSWLGEAGSFSFISN